MPSPLPEESQQWCPTPGQGTPQARADAQGPGHRKAGTTCRSNQALLGVLLLKRMVCFLMKIPLFQLFCKTDLQNGFPVCKYTSWSFLVPRFWGANHSYMAEKNLLQNKMTSKTHKSFVIVQRRKEEETLLVLHVTVTEE